MFTKEQKVRVDEIIRKRDATPKVYTEEELSWRYAIWQDGKIVGEKNIFGKITKLFLQGVVA